LQTLSPEFDALYADSGRPSIAPEYILRAQLLQVFYSVRSERLMVEQIDYNLLFRWFVGLGMDDAVWNHAVFSKNRDRLLTSDVAQQFFAEVNKQARRFMSDEHFTVDGTLIQAWASQKSFRSKDRSDDGDGTNFHGQSRSNKTHESTTDADARSFKHTDQFGGELKYFSECILTGEDPEPDAEEGFADVRVLEGILKALETGQPVKLESFQCSRRIDTVRQEITLDAMPTRELVHACNPARGID